MTQQLTKVCLDTKAGGKNRTTLLKIGKNTQQCDVRERHTLSCAMRHNSEALRAFHLACKGGRDLYTQRGKGTRNKEL